MKPSPLIVIDFSKSTLSRQWEVVDDGVMGGLSLGTFKINNAGYGEFSGVVSIENYGGFSSVRCPINPIDVHLYHKIKIRLCGDGKSYQLRLKRNANDSHSYKSEFVTTGDWQIIIMDFDDFLPTYRGRTLKMPKFPGDKLEEIWFLIGNGQSEEFKLEIDKIVIL